MPKFTFEGTRSEMNDFFRDIVENALGDKGVSRRKREAEEELLRDVGTSVASIHTMTLPVANPGRAEIVVSAPPPLRIDPAMPTIAELLARWSVNMRLADNDEKYAEDKVRYVREAAATGPWTWVTQMTPEAICKYLAIRKDGNDVFKKKLGPKSRNHIRAALLEFVRFCAGEHVGEAVDPKTIPKGKVLGGVRYIPTESDVVRLVVAATKDWRSKDRWLFWLVKASTALRMETMNQIEREWVVLNCETPYIEIPPDEIKGRVEIKVFLTAECAHWLAELFKRHKVGGRIWMVGRVDNDDFDGDLKDAGLQKKHGRKSFAPHSLRYFGQNRLRWAETCTPEERAHHLGHTSNEMGVRVYADPSHVEFGKKVFAMKPLLPAGFQPQWGDRPTKKGGKLIDSGKKPEYGVNANQKVIRETQPTSTRSVARSILTDADSQIKRASDQCDLAQQADHADLDSIGGIGSNPITPIDAKTPPDSQGGFSAEVLKAQAQVIASQARLIDLLLREERNRERQPNATN